jgi:hypothetical protein
MYVGNYTAGPIELVTQHCGAQAFISFDDEHMSTSAACPCACDSNFELTSCAPCGACAADVVQTLEPTGTTGLLTWDGSFWYTRESGCSTKYQLPDAYPLNAKICWRTPGNAAISCTHWGFQHGALYRPFTLDIQ